MDFERKCEIFQNPEKFKYGTVTDPQYGVNDQEIWSFGQFLPQTADLWKDRRLTPMDFEQKCEIFENP
jgi:hypothetical protein